MKVLLYAQSIRVPADVVSRGTSAMQRESVSGDVMEDGSGQ